MSLNIAMSRGAMAATVKSVVGIAQAHPALWLGFGCLCAWPWSTAVAVSASPASYAVGMPLWHGSNGVYLIIALGCCCMAVISVNLPQKGFARSSAVVAACCYGASSVMFVSLSKLAPATLLEEHLALALLWPLLAGVGQCLLFVSWVGMFGKVGPRATVALVVLGSVFGAGLICALGLMPGEVREVAPLFIGIAASVCAFLMAGTTLGPSWSFPGNRGAHRPPWRLLATALVAGFSFGIFQSLSFGGDFGGDGWSAYGVTGFFLAAIVFALTTLVFKMNFNNMMYRFSFVVMAFGALVYVAEPAWSSWGYGLFCIGYRFFDMLLWCLCAYLVHRRGAPFEWVGGLSIGMLLFGRFIGFELFGLLQQDQLVLGMEAIVAIVMFLLLTCALFLVSRSNFLGGWGMARPGEADDDGEALRFCCRQIAEEHQLSSRELDVLLLVAEGRSRAEAAAVLVLSEETVKTHLRHIYQKLAVHSRKELDGLVAARKADARAGNMGAIASAELDGRA